MRIVAWENRVHCWHCRLSADAKMFAFAHLWSHAVSTDRTIENGAMYTVSQKTSHLWLAVTLTYVNGFWYFLAQMLPIKSATKRHFTMPHQLTCAFALPGKTEKRENCIFPQCCISALPEFNQLLDFFNLFDSRLILTLLYDSLSLVINAFSYRKYWGHRSGERKSIALQQLDCVARTTHQCAVFWVSYFAR